MSLKSHTNICVEKKRSAGITTWKAVQQRTGISPWSELLPCSCSLCPHNWPWAPLLSGVRKWFVILFFNVGTPKWRSRAVGGILVLLKSSLSHDPFQGQELAQILALVIYGTGEGWSSDGLLLLLWAELRVALGNNLLACGLWRDWTVGL